MSKKPCISPEQYDKMIMNHYVLGMNYTENGRDIGFDETTIARNIQTFEALKNNDVEALVTMAGRGMTNNKALSAASAKLGKEIPDAVRQAYDAFLMNRRATESKTEPKPEVPEQMEGQTTFPEFNEIQLQFSKGSNNTLHALIDALNRNADESAQLRKAIFGLLHSAGCAE